MSYCVRCMKTHTRYTPISRSEKNCVKCESDIKREIEMSWKTSSQSSPIDWDRVEKDLAPAEQDDSYLDEE